MGVMLWALLLERATLDEAGLYLPFTWPRRMLSVRLMSSKVLLQALMTDAMSLLMGVDLMLGCGILMRV
jgi:hypothetical protein